jgi:hypothetical protein
MTSNHGRRRMPGLVLLLLVATGLVVVPATAGAQDRADRDPVARDDSYPLPEDARLLVRAPGVRANDQDPEGERLRVRIVRGPGHGTARLSERGRLRYTPDHNWSGTDSLVYVARDPAGHRDRARVTFKVSPVNDGPSISMTAQSPVREGSTSRITLTATDPEDDPLTYFFDCEGNGSFEVGPVTTRVHECAYDDEGDPTPVGRVRDSHGAQIQVALQIQVLNRRPVVTPGPDRTAEAGQPVLVDLGSFADPGDDGPWQVTVDWGDGSSEAFAAGTPGSLGSRNHTYAGGPDPLEVYDVVITVTEAGGAASGSGQLSVDVTS